MQSEDLSLELIEETNNTLMASDAGGTASKLAALHKKFNKGWLNDPVMLKKHSFASLNYECEQAHQSFVTTGADTHLSPEVTLFLQNLSSLERVRACSGFDAALLSRLELPNEIAPCCYEAYIADMYMEEGFEVSFIPSTNKAKSPDLLAKRGNEVLHIECKRKDRYVKNSNIKVATSDFSEPIDTLPGNDEPDGIALLSFGPYQSKMAPAMKTLVEYLPKVLGAWEMDKDNSCAAVRVHFGPTMETPPDGQYYFYVPPGYGYAMTNVRYLPKPGGGHVLDSQLFTVLDVFESHKIANIILTFDHARRQLPSDLGGVIAIDVDLSYLRPQQRYPYLYFMAEAIKTMFSPGKNTRVRTVMLTSTVIGTSGQPSDSNNESVSDPSSLLEEGRPLVQTYIVQVNNPYSVANRVLAAMQEDYIG